MKRLNVDVKDNNYPIYIKSGLFQQDLSKLLPDAGKVAIITNQAIADLYLNQLLEKLHGVEVLVLKAPDSEQAKSLDVYAELMTSLLESSFNRSSLLVALGGGVVGDLTGFLAATLHRGCRFVQVPTTLLAQVDSSVGGKTGINHAVGKNLIGSFYQPEAVVIDPDTLATLPDREFSAGMAEVIKYGFIEDKLLFDWLIDKQLLIKQHDPDTLEEMIWRCCDIKARVVAMDELEKGQRALLNYGHTFGHAIEQVAGYGKWLHGEAVATGMLLAMQLAINEGLCETGLYDELQAMLAYFDLPTAVDSSLRADQLTTSMLKDKKNLTETLRLVLPHGKGHTEIHSWNDLDVIQRLWREFGAA